MATVTPTLGVVARVTDVLATVRTWEGVPVRDAFRRLLESLPSDEQRSQLPVAVGEALLPLRLDTERLMLALDIAVAFDLYEASVGVARLLRIDPSPEVAARGAVLATHPGAAAELREAVMMAGEGLTSVDPVLARQYAMSRNPSYTSRSDAERLALVSIWPGRTELGRGDPPVIALAAGVGTVGQRLEFLLEAHTAGARVRRLPAEPIERPPDEWLPRVSVVVATSGEGDEWWRRHVDSARVLSASSLGPGARRSLLRRIDTKLPLDRRLRLLTDDDRRATDDPFRVIDAFFSGAFRTHEMAYLTGMTRNMVASTCRRFDQLKPLDFRGVHYWRFPTLVGLRAWTYVRRATGRRLDPALAAEFVRRAHLERAVPVAVRADGKVLMGLGDDEGGYSEEDGQITSERFFVAGVIRERFVLGGRQPVPDLVEPSRFTTVNPDVHGGSPTVRNTRVTVEVLDRAARRAIDDGMTGPSLEEHVLARFPEISSEELEDARRTARELAAVA